MSNRDVFERIVYTPFDSDYLKVDKHGIPERKNKQVPGIYIEHDPEYLRVDRHGIPASWVVNNPGYQTEHDPEYLGVDRHGIPASWVVDNPGYQIEHDPEYLRVDRHGIPASWVVNNPGYQTEHDPEYLRVDKHGIPAGWVVNNPGYQTEFDSEYLRVDKHGMPGGWAYPDQEMFQTDDENTIQFCKDVVDASQITETGFDKLSNLLDVQLRKIVELRHINTARKIVRGDTSYIESQLYLDLSILSRVINGKRNMYENDINLSYQIGEKYGNVLDVLDSYNNLISSIMITGKSELLNIISNLKESAEYYSSEMMATVQR